MKVKSLIRPGDIYAVHTGAYAGEMLLCIKVNKAAYCFLSIPNLINRDIDIPVVNNAIETKIIQYIENVPKFVLKTSTEQYKHNEKANNRRKQPNTQNVLGGKDSIS
jgi:hypothetical protein